jgi:general secretion pathway protein J
VKKAAGIVTTCSGFTLIELIVAMLITAIIFALGYGALEQALRNRESVSRNEERLRALQFTIRTLVQDFAQMAPRPIREPIGETCLPALQSQAGNGDSNEVTFTRGGWSNPAGLQRSTLQRVHYAVQDGKLRREYWSALDALIDPPPHQRELLSGVRSIKFRFMNDGHAWQDSWPPASVNTVRSAKENRWRPIAVEVTLELEDWGRIIRLVEVAG